jgi:hypothetical protein
MLSDATINAATDYFRNMLQAHDGDLAEELAGSEDGRATLTVTVSLARIAGSKYQAKIKCRVPRAATVTETVLPDVQLQLPGT